MPRLPEGQTNGRYGDAFDFICSVAESHGGYELLRTGDGFRACCPSHDDEFPSLSIDRGKEKVVVYCHTGCTFGEIRDAWELKNRDFEHSDKRQLRGRLGSLKKPPVKWSESLSWPVVATYVYELDGKPIFRKLRLEPTEQPSGKRLKTFRTERLENGQWKTGLLKQTPRVLYRQDELAGAIAAGKSIYAVEGEKDADRAHELGHPATCNFDGANGKWLSAYTEALSGADLLVVRDKDEAGAKHAERIASQPGYKSVRILEPATTDHPHADLSDHLNQGYGIGDLVEVRKVEQRPASWEPQNPDSVLKGAYVRLEPTLLARNDGKCLLYPGKTHWISGEPESGKSWLALIAASQVLRDPSGGRVLYLDYEDDMPEVVKRLLALDVPRSALKFDSNRFRYVQPQVGHEHEQAAFRSLLSQRWALVILDAVTEALSTEGKSGRDENEVADWANKVVKPFAQRTGAAVVCIDHVVKSQDNRGRWSIGSQHKLAVLSGAAYSVEIVDEIAPGQEGTLLMWVAKDRLGSVRRSASNWDRSTKMKLAARITLDATDPDNIVAQVWEPKEDDQDSRPSWSAAGRGNLKRGSEPELSNDQLEIEILAVLSGRGPSTYTEIRGVVRGKHDRIREAIGRLLSTGRALREGGKGPIRAAGDTP